MLQKPTAFKDNIRLSYFTKNGKEDELLDMYTHPVNNSSAHKKAKKKRMKKIKEETSFQTSPEPSARENSPKFSESIHWSNKVKTQVNLSEEQDLWQIIRLQAL